MCNVFDKMYYNNIYPTYNSEIDSKEFDVAYRVFEKKSSNYEKGLSSKDKQAFNDILDSLVEAYDMRSKEIYRQGILIGLDMMANVIYNKSKKQDDIMERYYSLGTVVSLKNDNQHIMICGHLKTSKADMKLYDYCGCLYPKGGLEPQEIQYFQHEDISEVIFKGYEDEKELTMNLYDKN